MPAPIVALVGAGRALHFARSTPPPAPGGRGLLETYCHAEGLRAAPGDPSVRAVAASVVTCVHCLRFVRRALALGLCEDHRPLLPEPLRSFRP